MKMMMRRMKKGLAGVLTFCILLTSMNTAAWAGQDMAEGGTALTIKLELESQKMMQAAQEAIRQGSSIDAEELGIKDSEDISVKQYQKLFGKKVDASLYEFVPELNGNLPDATGLRMFVRAEGGADYLLKGTEEIIFLFTNLNEMSVIFQVEIDGNKLPLVTIKSHSEEVQPVESTPAVETEVVTTESELKESTEETVEHMTEVAVEVTTENVSGDATENVTEDVAKNTTEDATEDATKDVTEEITENITEDTKQDTKEDTTEVATEQVAETVEEAQTEADVEDKALENGSDSEEIQISSRHIPVVLSSDEVYLEDADLTDEKSSNKKTTKNRIISKDEVSSDEVAVQESTVQAPKVIEGKLYDQVDLTEVDGSMVRAFVTTLDKFAASKQVDIGTTLVVRHGFESEGGDYRFIEEIVENVSVGDEIEAEVYDKKIALFPLAKSEPESLQIQDGKNEITLYYGTDSAGLSPAGKAVSLLPKGRSSLLSNLQPGEVKANKDARWTNAEKQLAEIVLSVRGEPTAKPVDVVLVLDGSYSMVEYFPNRELIAKGTNRLRLADQAAKSFINAMLYDNVGDEATDNRVGVVVFGDYVFGIQNFISKQSDTADIMNKYYPGPEGESGLYNGGERGGTRYQDAMQDAVNKMSWSKDSGRERVIVFMTDGLPTDFDLWNMNTCSGQMIANDFKNNGGSIYTVSMCIDKNELSDSTRTLLSERLCSQDETGKYLYSDISNAYDIKSVFENIAGRIRVTGTDAVIRDSLNDEYFELIDMDKLPAGVTVEDMEPYGKHIAWNVGVITKTPKTVTIPIKVKDGITLEEGSYYTNEDVNMTYTDVAGVAQEKKKEEIGEPTLSVKVKEPETTVPETTVPETTVPETTVPETTVPETTVPETTVPETTVPETTVPETTVPETTVPETSVPETTVPETTVPETTVSETTVPETTVPETTVPETTASGTTVPETTVPETTASGTTVPETTAPETTAPGTTTPETTAPGTTTPETTVPETTAPGTTVPETTTPGTTTPGNNNSGGGGSGGSRPGTGGSYVDNGPGAATGPTTETTTIIPEDVPLANLPIAPVDGNTALIDDGEIPLSSLPKTGEKSNAGQLGVLLSGILLGLFVTLKKRQEHNAK